MAFTYANLNMRQAPIDIKNRHKFEYHIGWNQNWWNYYSQYKIAVDNIVKLVESGTPIHTVSVPLLFLTRHSLELGLKANILRLEDVNKKVGKISLSGGRYHSLKLLYCKLEEHLNVILKKYKMSQVARNEIATYHKDFEPLKDILHKLDERSLNFRYPGDTIGNPNFERNEKVQIADIIDMYYKIQPILLYTEDVLIEEGVFDPNF